MKSTIFLTMFFIYLASCDFSPTHEILQTVDEDTKLLIYYDTFGKIKEAYILNTEYGEKIRIYFGADIYTTTEIIKDRDTTTQIVLNYYKNGILETIDVVKTDHSQRVAFWFDTIGNIKETIINKYGEYVHGIGYYKNGRPMGLLNLDSLKNGDVIYYYENGQKKSEGQFEDLQEVGIWKYYNENGELTRIDTFSLHGQIVGIYEFVYPYDTSDLIENHFIKLEDINGKISGIYYGTSDDFDQAREEYLPGFFKAKMLDLIITDTTINFKVKVNSSDIYTKVITPFDNPKNNKPWTIGLRYNERTYFGKVIGDSIVIKTKDFDPRPFVKRK